ncbi:hypothetical protein HY837_06385 [archaeon]|nr:hypothetical protein [archaeon]
MKKRHNPEITEQDKIEFYKNKGIFYLPQVAQIRNNFRVEELNDSYVTQGLENLIKALCSTDNIAKIKEVIYWITNRKTYLWRLDKPSARSEERAVVLGGYYDDFGIGFYDNMNCLGPARGVVVVRENSSELIK